MALYFEHGGQAGLVLEFLQRFLQRGLNVIGVGPGSKMHQQLAHVIDAFAQTGVEFIQCHLDLAGLRLVRCAAHQLHLNFQKCQ